MRTDDLQLINEVGTALYAHPEQAESRSIETLAAVSTLESASEEQSFERAVLGLLARAEKEGIQATAHAIHQPFYRLSPLERFVLVLLHSGRVSYQRLSRILKMQPFDLEALVWHARMKLASQPEVRLSAPHPTGTSLRKHQCPEYDALRPWTQRLLDDEMKGQERLMIQNHTMSCDGCRRALMQAREFYYAVDSQIPASTLSTEVIARSLREARLRVGDRLPTDLSWKESLRIFFGRKETRFWLAGIGAMLFWMIFRVR